MAILSSVALVIASVGIYGVTEYTAIQRTGEFGSAWRSGLNEATCCDLCCGREQVCLDWLVAGHLHTCGGGAFSRRCCLRRTPYIQSPSRRHYLAGANRGACVSAPAYRATRINPIEAIRASIYARVHRNSCASCYRLAPAPCVSRSKRHANAGGHKTLKQARGIARDGEYPHLG